MQLKQRSPTTMPVRRSSSNALLRAGAALIKILVHFMVAQPRALPQATRERGIVRAPCGLLHEYRPHTLRQLVQLATAALGQAPHPASAGATGHCCIRTGPTPFVSWCNWPLLPEDRPHTLRQLLQLATAA